MSAHTPHGRHLLAKHKGKWTEAYQPGEHVEPGGPKDTGGGGGSPAAKQPASPAQPAASGSPAKKPTPGKIDTSQPDHPKHGSAAKRAAETPTPTTPAATEPAKPPKGIQVKPLTFKELAAVEVYRSKNYEKINTALRDGSGTDTAILDAAIDKGVTTEPVTLYRGLADTSFVDSMKVGETFTDDAFTSTSTDEFFAYAGFAKESAFKIDVPAGFPALSLGDYENEVLLPRGTTFRLKSVESVDLDEDTAAQRRANGMEQEDWINVFHFEVVPTPAPTAKPSPTPPAEVKPSPAIPSSEAKRVADLLTNAHAAIVDRPAMQEDPKKWAAKNKIPKSVFDAIHSWGTTGFRPIITASGKRLGLDTSYAAQFPDDIPPKGDPTVQANILHDLLDAVEPGSSPSKSKFIAYRGMKVDRETADKWLAPLESSSEIRFPLSSWSSEKEVSERSWTDWGTESVNVQFKLKNSPTAKVLPISAMAEVHTEVEVVTAGRFRVVKVTKTQDRRWTAPGKSAKGERYVIEVEMIPEDEIIKSAEAHDLSALFYLTHEQIRSDPFHS